MKRQGFTLIEILLVIVIVGLLGAIAQGRFSRIRDKARTATLVSDLRNLMTAQEAYFESAGTYADQQSLVPANLSPGTDIDIWDAIGGGYGWRARARLIDRPAMRCGIYIGSGPPNVPGFGPVEEGRIVCQ